eukprot:1603102-Rhodomonas_salina.3
MHRNWSFTAVVSWSCTSKKQCATAAASASGRKESVRSVKLAMPYKTSGLVVSMLLGQPPYPATSTARRPGILVQHTKLYVVQY